MAQAILNDGQALLALNDLFIGQRTHTSARYTIHYDNREEDQSSSGVIVSTGAGSTGWYRSIVTGGVGLVEGLTNDHDLPAYVTNIGLTGKPATLFSVFASRLSAGLQTPRLFMAPLPMEHH